VSPRAFPAHITRSCDTPPVRPAATPAQNPQVPKMSTFEELQEAAETAVSRARTAVARINPAANKEEVRVANAEAARQLKEADKALKSMEAEARGSAPGQRRAMQDSMAAVRAGAPRNASVARSRGSSSPRATWASSALESHLPPHSRTPPRFPSCCSCEVT
jgi:hypothetical protein